MKSDFKFDIIPLRQINKERGNQGLTKFHGFVDEDIDPELFEAMFTSDDSIPDSDDSGIRWLKRNVTPAECPGLARTYHMGELVFLYRGVVYPGTVDYGNMAISPPGNEFSYFQLPSEALVMHPPQETRWPF